MEKNNKKREDQRAELRKYRFPFLMSTPLLICITLFVVIPVIIMIVMSFTSMDSSMRWEFIGINNYTKLLRYPDLKAVLLRTLLFAFCNVSFSLLGSIAVCIVTTYYLDIVYQRPNMGLFYRIIWLIPELTPQLVYVTVWRLFFGPEGFGLLNNFLAAINLPTIDWFTESSFTILIFINCLRSASGSIILFSSAIRQIPQHIIQSARVDGANNFHICRRIVLPYLKWPITQKTLWSILGSFTTYEVIRLLTAGGPKGSTITYAYYIFETAIDSFQYGYGAALSMFLVSISVILGLVMLRVFNIDKQLRPSRMDI